MKSIGWIFQYLLVLWPEYLSLALLGKWIRRGGSFDGYVGAVRSCSRMECASAKTIDAWRSRGVCLCPRILYAFCPPLCVGQTRQSKVIPIIIIVVVDIVTLVDVPVVVGVGKEAHVGFERRGGRTASVFWYWRGRGCSWLGIAGGRRGLRAVRGAGAGDVSLNVGQCLL